MISVIKKLDKKVKLININKTDSIKTREEEIKNSKEINSSDKYNYLYPNIDDINFSKKLSQHKEFNDTKYDGKIYDITKYAETICSQQFEILPHQQFVKNFLSFQTPYNGLLLYHGLGSGKTCSAIGVAEDMREYMKQIGSQQRIIIVASPNVQENFKIQLFDENKLKLVDGLWNIRSCVGNKLIREINPMNLRGIPKEKVVSEIKRLINSYYLFLGYIEFANYIIRTTNVGEIEIKNKDEYIKRKLNEVFNNRLIIIDEVHNIRISEDNKDKRVAKQLFRLVKDVDNLRLLFLSATPLYNSYKEIIWLLNILNLNDNREEISIRDIFDRDGNFKKNEKGELVGKELLIQKATGYISYVRGDNPYSFPFRIWPSLFNPHNNLKIDNYPRMQLNDKIVQEGIKYLSLYISKIGIIQDKAYTYIINKKSKSELENIDNDSENDNLGYMELQRPIEALNMVYPTVNLLNDVDFNIEDVVGRNGLNNIMTYEDNNNPPSKTNFEYKNFEKFGAIFSKNEISKYSCKIKSICDNILNSDGIILIYSQYLDSGIIPMCLALEELGITRFGTTPSLFKNKPVENLDLNTYTNTSGKDTKPAKYTIIAGDQKLTPRTSRASDLTTLTSDNNKNGELIKVVLISQAGSEGIDFKNIRQVHIMEPWYNMSRIEQIIGRGVRNCSHKDLPFVERNVEIFLHGTELINQEEESADLYVYRFAERKAIQIGKINRILKEISIDCLLNDEQLNFTEENMKQIVEQKLSNRETIKYSVGDKPYSNQCDYMSSCLYSCKPNNEIGQVNEDTYNIYFASNYQDIIIERIKSLMKERYFYKSNEFIKSISVNKNYPLVNIYNAIDVLLNNRNEIIFDKYNRPGNLINIGDYYLFQPFEITNKNISIFERSVPLQIKRKSINFIIDDTLEIGEKKIEEIEEIKDDIKEFNDGKKLANQLKDNFNIATNKQVIIRGEDNWYKFASLIFEKLEEDGYNKSLLHDLLIVNLVESLLFNQSIELLNYLYNSKLDRFENLLKNYYDGKIINFKENKGFLLVKDDKTILVIFNKSNNEWLEAEPEDYNDFAGEIKKKLVKIDDLNTIVGFIGTFKNEYMIFKVKQLNKKRNKGARCDQSGKADTIKLLNFIVGENKYNSTNTKGINQKQLCVLQEFLLRIYDYENKNSKRWFIAPTEAILINIEKLEI